MRTLEIYGQPGCKYCEMAKAFCADHDLPFVYRDTSDPRLHQELMRRFPEAKTVPQIFIGEDRIGGFDDLSGQPLFQLQQRIGGQ